MLSISTAGHATTRFLGEIPAEGLQGQIELLCLLHCSTVLSKVAHWTSSPAPNASSAGAFWAAKAAPPLAPSLHFPTTPFSTSCGIAMLENTQYIATAQMRAATLIAHVAPANTSPSSYMSTHSTSPTAWD